MTRVARNNHARRPVVMSMIRAWLVPLMVFFLSGPSWAGDPAPVDYDDLAGGKSSSSAPESRGGGPPAHARWHGDLRKSGVLDPALQQSLAAALATFLGAFTPDPRAKRSTWTVRDAGEIGETGATVRVGGAGYTLAGYPMVADMSLRILEGRVVAIPRFRIRMRAADLASKEARIAYAKPGTEIDVPVDPDTSRNRLEEGFAEAGFEPLDGKEPSLLRCRTPADGKGLLLVDATEVSKVWTAGTLAAADGGIAYRQRIVVYEGSVPRTFRSVVEEKVNEKVSESFRTALDRLAGALPVPLTFIVDAAVLEAGAVVVDGRADPRDGEASERAASERHESPPRSELDEQ